MSWTALFDSTRTHAPEMEIALRLVLASLVGGIVGLERELKDRPAGLRTHMLTSLAAAVFTIITFEIFHAFRTIEPGGSMDPIRVVEAVTAGVAFLGAGTILRGDGSVKGLTTAASMWLAGALGVACGAGFYTIAIMAVVLVVIILVGVRRLEQHALDSKGEASGGTRRDNKK